MAVRSRYDQYAPVEAPIRRRSANRRSGATIDSVPHTIIGVLPRVAFPFDGVDVWVTKPSEFSGIQHRQHGDLRHLLIGLAVAGGREPGESAHRTDVLTGGMLRRIRVRPGSIKRHHPSVAA